MALNWQSLVSVNSHWLSSLKKETLLCRLLALGLIFGTLHVPNAALAEEASCETLLSERSVFRLTKPEDGVIKSLTKRMVERMVGLSKLLKMYEAGQHAVRSPEDFWSVLLNTLNIELDVIGNVNQIPAKGKPLVIVANHPYGFLDGVSLAHLISQRRDDYMILGNALLSRIPEIRSRIIPVHILKGSRAEKREKFLLNREALKLAQEHVKAGGVLIAFPSGVVATSDRLTRKDPAIEQEWQTSVAKIIIETKASSLPVYFDGKNSLIFHLASRLHQSVREAMRVALLPSELLKKMGKPVRIVLGKEVPMIQLQAVAEKTSLERAKAFTDILRNQVMALSGHPELIDESLIYKESKVTSDRELMPIDKELSSSQRVRLLNELMRKGKIEVYREKDSFVAYKIKGSDFPEKLLHHLGVLREKTFREVGEGSGKSSDIDEFDLAYDHLLIWNKKEKDIVGAYRLGSYEEARRTGDFSRMYTHAQFQYQPEFFKHFRGGMLEMGRSFVVSKYQNDESAPVLSLLWGAIAEYLYRNDSYRYMCGPVSLSGDYSDLSKTLIKAYFMKNHGDTEGLKGHLKPGTLFPNEVQISKSVMDEFLNQYDRMSRFDSLIETLEGPGKGVPPLVKHYPGLMGAKFIEASFDPEFNTLDFLICVDLKDLDERKAQYFVGDKEKAKILSNRFK